MRDMHQRPGEPDAFRLLVSPYSPDTLRYPASDAVTTPSERLRHALTWNVFKTLEQIAPSVWMRPLLAMSAGLPEGYDSAPHITKVTCWSNLKPAPSAILRRGRRNAVPVSAIIDTDDTVITFLTPSATDLTGVLSDTKEEGLLDLAEATAWLAGTRSAYVSVVLPIEVDEEVWATRVRRRAERVRRVLEASPKCPANVRGIGATTWSALHHLLSEISASRFIAKSEQRCALTTVEWMAARLGPDLARQRLA